MTSRSPCLSLYRPLHRPLCLLLLVCFLLSLAAVRSLAEEVSDTEDLLEASHLLEASLAEKDAATLVEEAVAVPEDAADYPDTGMDEAVADEARDDALPDTLLPDTISTDTPPIIIPLTEHPVAVSEGDARAYRYLTLPNGLRLLLISDPAAEKAAAALSVAIGSNQNPPERPGLAHFLEHMLFLGTAKYPKAGEYQAFISQHGGRYNAYTSAEHTNYFFDIDADHLAPALDRFAQFFIAPLLDADYVERERNAVHSEYRARIRDDSRRSLDAYRDIFNPAHPGSGFTVGTAESLVDREDSSIRDELLDFYHRYYSPQLMTLVVMGREPLDDLQSLAVPRFAAVSGGQVDLPESYPPLFNAGVLPAQISIRPEKELRQLSFMFPIPNDDRLYPHKPFDFIAHLLGHEGEGSLFSLLKHLGWAEALRAGTGLKSRHDGLFVITLDLTEKGVRAREQIPVLVFHMIRQLETRALKDWHYLELQQMADINFRYLEKSPPLDTVRDLANDMQVFAPEDLLRGRFLFRAYDEKLIRRSLGYLRPENLLLSYVAPDAAVERESFYYGTPYKLSAYQVPEGEVKPAVRKRLGLPPPNAFIPARLGVKSQPLLPGPSEATGSTAVDIPRQIVQSERTRVWFQQDQLFEQPRSHIYLRLKLPQVAQDTEGAAQAHLFAALVRDQLNEFTYPARLAGLSYDISANPRGLQVHIAGYSSRQGLLLNTLAEHVRRARFTPERFELLKTELMRDWRNNDKNSPYLVLLPQITRLHFDPYWSDRQLADALEARTFADFQQFASRILRDAELEALFYGNLYRQEAIKLASLAEHQLLGPRSGRAFPQAHIYQMAEGDKPWLFPYALDHSDRIAVLYLQALGTSDRDQAHMQLLRQMLRPLFFDQLRTEKQLGYVVAAIPMALRQLEGIAFVVQSPATPESRLLSEIDGFMADQLPHLTDNLAENRAALIRQLEEPPRSLAEQADRLWGSLLLGDTRFDRRQRLARALAQVDEASLQAYYRAVMLNRERRLWLTSGDDALTEDVELLRDVTTYRQRQKAVPYH